MVDKKLIPSEKEKKVKEIKEQAYQLFKLIENAQLHGISITIQYQNNLCNFTETFFS